jgi:F0F1-type ATP synthase assembly protein I
MQQSNNLYKPGRGVFLGIVLGTFLGILFNKLALGMIFGFFVGVAVDSWRRKAASASKEIQVDDGKRS